LTDGAPASRSGQLQTGDVILAINDKPTQTVSVEKAQAALRGPVDTPVAVTVRRSDKGGKLHVIKVSLVRKAIRLPEIKVAASVRVIDARKIVTLTPHLFYDKVWVDVMDALNTQQWKVDGGIDALILDLRGNLGGTVSEAVKIANFF